MAQNASFRPWLEAPLCQGIAWPGIGCSGGQLTEIRLEGVLLNRSLPPSFANLTNLQRLVLKHNNLTGGPPARPLHAGGCAESW